MTTTNYQRRARALVFGIGLAFASGCSNDPDTGKVDLIGGQVKAAEAAKANGQPVGKGIQKLGGSLEVGSPGASK